MDTERAKSAGFLGFFGRPHPAAKPGFRDIPWIPAPEKRRMDSRAVDEARAKEKNAPAGAGAEAFTR